MIRGGAKRMLLTTINQDDSMFKVENPHVVMSGLGQDTTALQQ